MRNTGVSTEWPLLTETSCGWPFKSFFLRARLRRLLLLTKRSKSRDASVPKNLLNSSMVFSTASKRNWKLNGFTRTNSHSKAEGHSGTGLRRVPHVLPQHSYAGRSDQRSEER